MWVIESLAGGVPQASTGHGNNAGSCYAAAGVAAIGLRYFSSRVSIAHEARAVLCATATAVTFGGLRAASASSHGRGVTFFRNTFRQSLSRHG